ncbi:MAG: hypothetical protein LBL90_01370, partial [Prevotellaceae bacterium]|nr:hypothetical protein [Prevotellaceae bacterium]
FSGNYNDLNNSPFIPSKLGDLDDDANHRIVTDVEKTAWNAKSNFSGNYNDLNNIPELLTPAQVNTLVNNAVSSAILAAFPAGCVIMWYGDPNNIPSGWEIFYQMSGRFPVAAFHLSSDEGLTKYSLGNTGGEEKHTLTIAEMPAHNHGLNINYGDARHGDGGNSYSPAKYIGHDVSAHWTGTTNHAGSGGSHENRPPYFAIYFIKKK